MNSTGTCHPVRDAVAGNRGKRAALLGLGLSLALATMVATPSFAQDASTTVQNAPTQVQESQSPVEQPAATAPKADMTQAPAVAAGDAQQQPGTAEAGAAATPDNAEGSDAAPTGMTTELQPEPALPEAKNAALPHDLSPWGMFMAADIVVKAVMVSLAFASVVTWTVWLAKSLELLTAKRRLASALRVLSTAHSLHDAEKSLSRMKGPAVELARATRAEWAASADLPAEGIKDRAATAMSRIEARAGRSMSVGTGLLATIGSTAPFVGLFGTVWGIMNSFIGISKQQTTNLAVVAPGIAEALLATALGLVAAIPAVVLYNMFSRWVSGYRALYAEASNEVERLVSRDLDRMMRGLQNGLQNGLQSGLQDDRPIRRNIAAE